MRTVVGYSNAEQAGSPTDRRSTSGYCIFVGGNLVSWKNKKQTVVARFCELVWLKQLLKELKFAYVSPMILFCDNQVALHISSNPVFHERTKHIEKDCHFIQEKIIYGYIKINFVNSKVQLANVFTKILRGPRIDYICNKFGAYQLHAPT